MARSLHRSLVALFLLGVVAQFFLAGFGAFRAQHDSDAGVATTSDRFAHDFSPHVLLGHILLIAGAVVFVTALAARLPRGRVLAALALPFLVELQSVLANAGPVGFRALHPVNGCAILGLSAVLALRARRDRQAERSAVLDPGSALAR